MRYFPDYVSPVEVSIAHRLILRALARGYDVSVYDGEEWALRRSTDIKAIEAVCFATDETTLSFKYVGSTNSAPRLGTVLLILGNGEDVVSDHTDNEAMQNLVCNLG